MLIKPILGYEEIYSIRKDGQVLSHARITKSGKPLEDKWLRPGLNGSGYLRVNLRKNEKVSTHSIHRLLATAFISNPSNYPIINHINGIKTDNRLDNIEWCTYSRNNQHAYDTGLKVRPCGELAGKAKLKEADILAIKVMYIETRSCPAVAKHFNVHANTVRSILRGDSWGHLHTDGPEALISSKIKNERHGPTKLKSEDIPVIRQMFAEIKNYTVVSTHFKVSRTTIESIIKGKAWKHVL